MPPANTQRGFTLIEILVVMTIMVLVYAITAPMISTGASGAPINVATRPGAAGPR